MSKLTNSVRVFALGALAILSVASGCGSSVQPGWAAYNSGDYVAAAEHWTRLAEEGDAEAQFLLGTMYDKGQGVEEDPEHAATWYTLAANQSHAAAQNN